MHRPLASLLLAISVAPWLWAALPTIEIDEMNPFATGLVAPVLVTNAGDGSGRLFAVEQLGRVRRIEAGGAGPHPVFLDISAQVLFVGDERGLLGLAFHPAYDGVTERRFFVYYSYNDGTLGHVSRIPEFQTAMGDINSVPLSSENVLLVIDQPQTNHNGGMIEFGPSGYLHIATGDGGGAGDDDAGHTPGLGNGQDNTNLLGAILRIGISATPGQPYTIPTDNPFADGGDPGADEIYIMGLRNPFRFSIDQPTSTILIGDVGQGSVEEIDIYGLAALDGTSNENNAGWRILEGDQCYNPSTGCVAPTDYLPPHHTYSHANPRDTVIGGYVHRGTGHPSLNGLYFFGDYGSGEIWVLEEMSPGMWTTTPTMVKDLPGSDQLLSFGKDEDGELYVCRVNGDILRIIDPNVPVGLSVLGTD